MDPHAQPNKLHIIEFNEKNLIPGSSSWKSTSESVRQALESYGCLVVDYEKSRLEPGDKAVFGVLEELFGLPMETKMKYTSKLGGFGYEGNYPRMPLYESFGLEDGESLETMERFTKLMWPLGHDKFCETMQSNSKLSLELLHMVMKMVLSSYGLDKYYNSLIESSFYLKRLIRYKSQDENVSSIGLFPHRDKTFLGIISTNEVKGLEIETPQGDWIEFEPSPSKYIVIVGEAFMAWSNAKIYCPLHRVVARGSKEKYSIGDFCFIRGILQVPEELLDHEKPLKFNPFSNLEFLQYCKLHGASTIKGAIQAYCGI